MDHYRLPPTPAAEGLAQAVVESWAGAGLIERARRLRDVQASLAANPHDEGARGYICGLVFLGCWRYMSEAARIPGWWGWFR